MRDRSAHTAAVTELTTARGRRGQASGPAGHAARRAAGAARAAPIVVLAILVALVGFVGVAVATRDRPGATVDSAEYLAVAQGLRGGHGFTSPYLSFGEPFPDVVHPAARVPLDHFPPLYPLVLAGLSAASRSQPMTTTRWLGAAALAAVAAMITYLVGSRGRSRVAAAVAGGLTLAPDVLVAHSMVWTEGLFGLSVVATILLLDRHLTRPCRASAAALVAAAAAAPLIRYAGIAVPVAVGLSLVIGGQGRLKRWRDAAVLGGGSLVPLILWLTLSGHGLGRGSGGLIWHRPDAPQIKEGFAVVAGWFSISGSRAWQVGALLVLLVAVAGLVAMACGILRRRGVAVPGAPGAPSSSDVADARRRLVSIVAVLSVTYLLAVIASRLFVDAAIPFDARLLMPLHLMVAIGLPLVALSIDATSVRRAALVLLGLVALLSVRHGVHAVSAFPRADAGYLDARWRRSAGIEAIRELPPKTLVVTNAPDPVWLQTRRAPLFIPLRTDLYADRPNPQYRHELRALAAALHGRAAVIVFFRRPTRGTKRYLDRRVLAVLDFGFDRRLADAVIYRSVGGAPR